MTTRTTVGSLLLAMLPVIARTQAPSAGALPGEAEVRFENGATRIRAGSNEVRMSLAAWGRDTRMTAPEAPIAWAGGNRFEYRRGPLTEWWIHDASGLEHGFTLAHSPSGEGMLRVALEISGDLTPRLRSASAAVFERDGETVLVYDGLKAWDAAGRALTAHLEVEGNSVVLVAGDAGAVYPVTIDPFVQRARLTAGVGAVSVSGDSAIAGAPSEDSGNGAAYFFVRNGMGWSQQQRIASPLNQGAFGSAVAISGDTAVIGAPASSHVYVFVRNGGVWSQQADLSVVGQNSFGTSVAVSGDSALAGSPGEVDIYTRTGSSWSLAQHLAFGGNTGFAQFALALTADTALIGVRGEESQKGAAYVYVRNGATWSLQQRLTASIRTNGDQFGASVAIDGNAAIIGTPGFDTRDVDGDPTSPLDIGAVFFFTRSGAVWTEQQYLSGPSGGSGFGASVGLSGAKAVTSEYNGNASIDVFAYSGGAWTIDQKIFDPDPLVNSGFGFRLALNGETLVAISSGFLYVFRPPAFTISSSSPGEQFAVSGAGCPASIQITPYSFESSVGCTIAFTSPYLIAPGRQDTFQAWQDGPNPNPRNLLAPLADITYTGNFSTQYQLTTTANPPGAGSVTGAGWYPANTNATSAAVPQPGFLFNNFSGAMSGNQTPQQLLMNGAKDVTGNFVATPPANLTGSVTAKSGTQSNRQWTITLTNSGPGSAYNAQIHGLILAQTFGTACTPVRLSPAAFPVTIGNIGAGSSAPALVNIDFTGCADTARFSVTVVHTANSGSSGGALLLANQLR